MLLSLPGFSEILKKSGCPKRISGGPPGNPGIFSGIPRVPGDFRGFSRVSWGFLIIPQVLLDNPRRPWASQKVRPGPFHISWNRGSCLGFPMIPGTQNPKDFLGKSMVRRISVGTPSNVKRSGPDLLGIPGRQWGPFNYPAGSAG